MTTFHLAPNPDHAAASRSFHLAANCLRHAALVPHTAERERVSARQWIESARYWQRQAAFYRRSEASSEAEPRNERWAAKRPSLSWECELAIMLARSAAAAHAGVE